MKKILFFTVALTMIATAAMAANDMSGRIGLGFTSSDFPVGVRYWASQKVGVDVGLGYMTHNDHEAKTYGIDVGVPIVIDNMADRVAFLVRPGFNWMTMDPGNGGDKAKVLNVSAALEFEVNVTDDFTVSAAQGFQFSSYDSGISGSSSTSDYGFFGNNWTSFGFHYYLKKSQ